VNGFNLLMDGIDLSVLNYHTTPLEDMEINMVFIDDKDYVIMDDGREIELNKFIDGENIVLSPKDLGEAEGLARSINRLFKIAKGEKEIKCYTKNLNQK